MSDTTTKVEPIPVIENADGTAVARFIEEQKDERLGRNPDEEEDEGSAGGGASETSRSRSARRRERTRRARDERDSELSQMRTMFATQQQLIDSLFVSQGQQSLTLLEGEAEKAKAAYAEAQRRKAKAVDDGDGAAVVEADQVMTNATTYYNNVAAQHANLTTRLKAQPTTQQPQPNGRIAMTAAGKELMEDFLDEHPFVDPKKNDATSVAIRAIEARIAAEGGDPNVKDYWDDVSDALREAMPHLFTGGRVRDDTDDPAPPRRDDDNRETRRERRRGGPPLGDSGRANGGDSKNDVRLTADMVTALDQAGIPLTGGAPDMVARRNKVLQSWRDNRPARN